MLLYADIEDRRIILNYKLTSNALFVALLFMEENDTCKKKSRKCNYGIFLIDKGGKYAPIWLSMRTFAYV